MQLFDHRYLLVQHGLSPSDERILRRLARRHRDIRPLRELMDEVYRLFDRRCRTDSAQVKLAKLRSRLSRFKHLGKVLSKLQSPNLDKALTFLDDKELEALPTPWSGAIAGIARCRNTFIAFGPRIL